MGTTCTRPETSAATSCPSARPPCWPRAWPGFPTARHRLIEQLAEDSPLVAPELIAPPISSPLFPADVSTRAPQLTEQLTERLNGHGYLTVAVERTHLEIASRMLDAVQDPASAITTASTYRVDAGSPVAVAT